MGTIKNLYFNKEVQLLRGGKPTAFITGAFDWADSEKGFDYWAEMTLKFCESHPLVETEEA